MARLVGSSGYSAPLGVEHAAPGRPAERVDVLPTKAEVREMADEVVSHLTRAGLSDEGMDRVLAQARADVQFEIRRSRDCGRRGR